MDDQAINKLAGQLRGLEEVVISLACALEMKGSIDGPMFTGYLNGLAGRCRPAGGAGYSVEQTLSAQAIIRRISTQIDQARTNRQ